ncbi:OmpA family protein [Flavobacterium aquidurense]|uniref:OmpA family protein n=1 Tax=Flavobacterium aquidurense TaxID=362413 RepID=UPI003716508A
MKKKHILYALVFSISLVQAQKNRITRADKQYNQYAFVDAGDMYHALVKKGFTSAEIYGKLGDTYFVNADYNNALKAYHVMYEKGKEKGISDTRLFRYAQSLKSNQKFQDAAKIIVQLNKNSQAFNLTEDDGYLTDIEKQSNRYEINPVRINTAASDFGVAFYKDNKVIFTSARDTANQKRFIDKWNKKPFFKLYEATINEKGDLLDAKKIEGKINSVFHQSTPAITKDGNTIYFTRSNYLNGKFGKDSTKVNHLKIYKATLKNGEWANIEDLAINDAAFSNAHPALSPDEKSLIFASDRPGSMGETDLYEVQINADGIFGEVRNMGASINTIGRETFPFITDSGQLYFASDGHPGLGGLDIFEVLKNDENRFDVVNVGKPVNSNTDDFAYIINSQTQKGYFSSNRAGQDDIYGFTELKKLKKTIYELLVYGKTYDKTHNELIPNVKVKVYSKDNVLLDEYFTDNSGEYLFKVPIGEYFIIYEKKGYLPEKITLKGAEKHKNQSIEINQQIEKDPNTKELITAESQILKDGSDLVKTLDLKPIYFHFDGFDITPSAKVELNKVLQILIDYPTISIEIRSYTDKWGKADYNLKLSEKRAKATVNYLVRKGVRKDRIRGKGYGYVFDSESEEFAGSNKKANQLSRKSEFIITIN